MSAVELPTVTPRQLEALVSIFLGDGYRQRRVYRGHGYPALYGSDEDIPDWGKASRIGGYASSMGGATARMLETLADKGLVPRKEYERIGGSYVDGSKVTSLGLRVIQQRHPTIPNIAEKLAEVEAAEAEAVSERERIAAEMAQQREQRAVRRQREREERMAAILRDYQVSHSLTPDQLAAIWLRVVDEEMAL